MSEPVIRIETSVVTELTALRARVKELEEALESLVALYDDDIGMDSFPDGSQIEIKSTTLGVLRAARKALKGGE